MTPLVFHNVKWEHQGQPPISDDMKMVGRGKAWKSKGNKLNESGWRTQNVTHLQLGAEAIVTTLSGEISISEHMCGTPSI